jgi:hypothetical protein
MDLTAHRSSDRERARASDMMALVPEAGTAALDIGARDGFFSSLLAERYAQVVALDLERPAIAHARITCVQGDATALQFPDGAFDLVFCAEVLEHIPTPGLERACRELARVASVDLVIGVPYRQDIRLGRTTCRRCGKVSPPWGHVNRFDEHSLPRLFPSFTPVATSFVGTTRAHTNALSASLMDYAGNPFGSYAQLEACVHCGAAVQPPAQRNMAQRLATRTAHLLTRTQQTLVRPHANWLHMRLRKNMRADG